MIRYLQGYVEFKAKGVFVERFLNLVARERIPIWDGRKRGEVYTGYVTAASYAKMRAQAKKSGVNLRLSKKVGMPFHRRRLRRRTGLFAGVCLFAIFLAVMSLFIWRIDVSGNEEVPEDRIMTALLDIGIRPGTLRSGIDVRDSERRMSLIFEEFSWVALNIEGSVIRVVVNERVMPPPMIDPNTPTNIVADRAGQIISMRIFDGQPMVVEGDTVLPGDIMVSGITEDRLSQNLFRHSLADIEAEIAHTIAMEISLDQIEYRPTGQTRRRNYLGVMSLELPMFWPREIPAPYRVERFVAPITFLSLELPVRRPTETYTLMEEYTLRLSQEEAEERALTQLEAVELVEFGDGRIIDRVLDVELTDSAINIRADYIVHMSIGRQVEIQVYAGD